MNVSSFKIVIREDLAHFSPIGVDWYNAFRRLGYDIKLISDRTSLLTYTTDIDLFINMMGIEDADVASFVSRLKRDNPKCIILSTVAHPLERQEAYFDYVDCWFDCGYDHPFYQHWYGSRGQKFLSVMEAADTDLFFKGEVEESYMHDFSFIGQFGQRGHGYRGEDQYLYPFIDDQKLTNYLFGFSYKHVAMQHVPYAEVNTVYNCSRINLNFHYPEQKTTKTVINRRTFDIAASGNFQLVDHPKFEQLTGIKTYQDPKDYRDAFYYYLNNPTERYQVANNAQQIILESHTWDVRMKTLLNELHNL